MIFIHFYHHFLALDIDFFVYYVSFSSSPRIDLTTSVFVTDSPRYRGLNGEVENWMQWIDDSNSDELLDIPEIDIDVDEFIGGNIIDNYSLDGSVCI